MSAVTSAAVPAGQQGPADQQGQAEQQGQGAARRVVQRVVFPADRDLDTLPLYVDFNAAAPTSSGGGDRRSQGPMLSMGFAVHADYVLDRRRLRCPEGTRLSLGTYFNAFPAAYWRRWTSVSSVRLSVAVSGSATVIVYRSNARGNAQRVSSVDVQDDLATFDLPLAPFGDGGWYWFDLAAGTADGVLEEADWSVEAPDDRRGTVSIAITTYNRPDYCVAQIRNLGAAADALAVIDEVLIVDQGTAKVRDDPGYDEAAPALGERLRIVDQGNIGGSGGFARGMFETSSRGRSDYVLLLDDDVVVEPEGIVRGVAFADLCRTPTIVGGHMFNMFERSRMHSWGERVDQWRFFWGSVRGTWEAHDFAGGNLRGTSWMHRRVDVDYNGWWMCLIPVSVVREIGLALPLFIKWDDGEYGLRAKAAGYPTVTLPGTAVWHVPWTDKDDTIDWQAYYHQRNRWVAALLYSPYDRGGNLPKESFLVDVKHLLSLQYSAVELRLRALEDLLAGPEKLHEHIVTKLSEVRQVRAQYPDAQLRQDPAAFPAPKRSKPPRKGREPEVPSGRVAALVTAAAGGLRQFRPVRDLAREHPEASVAAMDSRWWLLSQFDSALVTSADGTGASWYRRSPREFRRMLARSMALHQRLLREWPRLRRQYRAALPDLTSPQRWEQTFADADPSGRPGR